MLLISASLAEKPLPSRAYFETLDKGSRLEDIVEDIGQGGVKGISVIFHTWQMDDGSETSVIFDSEGRISLISLFMISPAMAPRTCSPTKPGEAAWFVLT